MSLETGLIYTYTKPKGPATTDPWYFTAIDFETGETVWKELAGNGSLYNNHYAGAYIGPDGTLYVGVLGGIVAVRNGNRAVSRGTEMKVRFFVRSYETARSLSSFVNLS